MSLGSNTLSPEQVKQQLSLGLQFLATGKFKDAAECCRTVLSIHPDLPQGNFLVALVSIAMKDRSAALQALVKVTRLQPNHAVAWAHMANLLMDEGLVDQADKALIWVHKLGSTDPLVSDILGDVHHKMGDYEIAGQLFESSVNSRPTYAPYLMKFANNLVFRGKVEEAESWYKKLLSLQPADAFTHWCLARTHKAINTNHVESMRLQMEAADIDKSSMAMFYYAIGKECEDLEDWDGAIKSYLLGAEAHRTTITFDESSEIELFDCLQNVCTREWLGDGRGVDSNAPIFIVGEPRTGTTLLERLVAAHSKVETAGELKYFALSLRRLTKCPDQGLFSCGLIEASLTLDPVKVAELYLQTTKRLAGSATHFIDKLPSNYLVIPFILKAFPHAKIIHVTRDPMDSCFASLKQLFGDAYPHSYDQAEMARHHARYSRLMGVYRERFSDRFHEVSYESLVGNTESTAKSVFAYLGLSWEDSCLDFHKYHGAVSTASAVQVREPTHTRSVGRWRRYEKHLQPMLAQLKALGIEVN